MIHFNQVSFQYKKKKALFNQMSFKLENGKIYGLLGLNGAGKTTALKIIAGLLQPQDGHCTLDNDDTFKRSPETLSKLFYVSDEFTLPKGSVLQYMNTYAPFYPNFSESNFTNCLNEFGISLSDKTQDMSYGQLKKVYISFGIAVNTSILLLDEPTNGLDIPSKAVFRKLIASAITDEKSIILSTHQVLDVENLIDHLLIMQDGKMILDISHNKIVDKIMFSPLNGTEENSDILYAKEQVKGQLAILKNTNNHDSKINIELLFTGILSNPSIINEF